MDSVMKRIDWKRVAFEAALALSFGLCVACLDVVVGVFAGPRESWPVWLVGAAFGVSFAAWILFYGAARAAVPPLWGLPIRASKSFSLALGVGWGVLFRLGSWMEGWVLSLNPSLGLRMGLAAAVSVAAGVRVYRLAGDGENRDFSPSRALVLLVLADLAVLVCSKGLFPGPFLESRHGFAFFVYGAVLFAGLSFSRGRLLSWSLPAIAFAAMAGGAFLWGERRTAMASDREHPIQRVVLIVVDTLRADALKEAELTPRMRELAAEGVCLEEAVSPAPWTLPAVASFMTGLSPLVHLATTAYGRLPEGLPTLAEGMREAGYATAAVGDNLVLAAPSGLNQGFQEYHFLKRSSRVSEYNVGGRWVEKWFPDAVGVGRTSDHVARAAVSWLRGHRERDFFFWIHLVDPHLPYAPPPSERHSESNVPTVGGSFHRLDRIRSGFWTPGFEEREAIQGLYRGEIAYVDRCVGWILDGLKELDLYDEALIVLTSDHGEEFWEHGGFEHGHTLYEEVLRVPLVFKLPAGMGTRSQGERIETPVTTESLTPTLLDLCGIEHDPEAFTAPSLAELVLSPGAEPFQEPLVSSGLYVFEDRACVRFGDKKYIRHLMSGKEELYDLEEDAAERRSLHRTDPSGLEEGRRWLAEAVSSLEEMREIHGITGRVEGAVSGQRAEHLKKLGYLK